MFPFVCNLLERGGGAGGLSIYVFFILLATTLIHLFASLQGYLLAYCEKSKIPDMLADMKKSRRLK